MGNNKSREFRYGRDWQDEYQRKQASAEEAAQLINPGERLYLPLAGASVTHHEIAKRMDELKSLDIHMARPMAQVVDFTAETNWEDCFRIEHELFIGDENRWATDEKRTLYNPVIFSLQMKPYDEDRPEKRPIDVIIIKVTPPNDQGFCNFGPNLWHSKSLAERSKLVMAEVDDTIPTCHGEGWIHVSDIDTFILTPSKLLSEEDIQRIISMTDEDSRDEMAALIPQIDPLTLAKFGDSLAQFPPDAIALAMGLAEPEDVTKKIASYVKDLVHDGDCFQIGVGEPSASLIRLGVFDERNDLGIHSELTAAGIGTLVDKGIANGKYKSIHKGKAIATSWSGASSEDIEIITNNPLFELHESHYVVNIKTIAQNDNQLALNNAISVDLLGQINSESAFGPRMINGSGGQPETHMGALMSKGGRAITLMPSTRLEGAISSIVPMFDQGTTVTIPRHWADIIITEYGVARLMGKNHRQRAEALIEIAHPDFRDELKEKAKELFYA
ncbi:MAG: acetyl-CoA hydrolase/transferase C-terminal domain-containing protein [Desulfobacterales bacterium]